MKGTPVGSQIEIKITIEFLTLKQPIELEFREPETKQVKELTCISFTNIEKKQKGSLKNGKSLLLRQ